MNFANTLRNAWKRSAGRSDTESKLKEAHEAIAAHVAKIDMRYACQEDSWAEISPYWVELCDGVQQVECQLPTVDCTLLNVVCEPESVIPEHHHEKHRETIFVVEGEIVDECTGVVVGANGVYVIPRGRPHKITSKRGALLNVLFHPKYKPGEEKPCEGH